MTSVLTPDGKAFWGWNNGTPSYESCFQQIQVLFKKNMLLMLLLGMEHRLGKKKSKQRTVDTTNRWNIVIYSDYSKTHYTYFLIKL